MLAKTEKSILDSAMLHIGSTKQYFVDNLMVESVQNIARKIHRPERNAGGPVLVKDKPWENVPYFTVSSWRVVFDHFEGIFKCWYEDWMFKTPLAPGEDLHDHNTRPSRYLYACSKDGVHWEKPALGIVYENGESTNIVFGGGEFGSVHSGYVFFDPSADQSDEKYKIFFDHRIGGISRYEVASSADGISWRPWESLPRLGSFGPHLGDVLTISRDQHAKIYRINTRHPRMCDVPTNPGDPYPGTFCAPSYPEDFSRQNKRRIFQAISSDFVNWSNLSPIVVPDDGLDNLEDSFYGMTQMPLGDLWIGFLHVFHMARNTMDVQLLYSRDGSSFQRIQPGQAWLESGPEGSWDDCMVNVYGEPIAVGDDLYIYYGGSRNHHDWWIVGDREGLDVGEARELDNVRYSLGLAKMKKDRFVSLSAFDVREGIVVTRPFRAAGERLFINAACRPGGYIGVAIATEDGSVLPGFEQSQCIRFSGDSVDHRVEWRDAPVMPARSGFLKLHFFMKEADLFSFQWR